MSLRGSLQEGWSNSPTNQVTILTAVAWDVVLSISQYPTIHRMVEISVAMIGAIDAAVIDLRDLENRA